MLARLQAMFGPVMLNMGELDRTARTVVGVLLVSLATLGVIGLWGFIGVLPLVTAIVGYCPAYALLGLNTCGTSGA
ncbi:MAG: DUF2892 domain-containing protein [Acetobacteraceae bacterium]